MNVNQYGLQQSYLRAYNAIVQANINGGMSTKDAQIEADNAVLSQSYLRLEQPLTNSASNFTFPILVNATQNNNATRATEVRLAQQDSFFCSNISFYIALAASATDTAFRLQTFPNVNIFPTGAAGLETVSPLNTLYNGFMQIIINKSVIVPNYPLSNFLQVPQTQRVSTTAGLQSNQFDPSAVSLWEPNINFVGTKSSNITVVTPGNISAVDANTYMVIVIQGVLAQNVTLMS